MLVGFSFFCIPFYFGRDKLFEPIFMGYRMNGRKPVLWKSLDFCDGSGQMCDGASQLHILPGVLLQFMAGPLSQSLLQMGIVNQD